MEEAFFVFTFGVVFLNLMQYLSTFGSQKYSPASLIYRYKIFNPCQGWIFYPAFFYQIWWVCDKTIF